MIVLLNWKVLEQCILSNATVMKLVFILIVFVKRS
jgi:hypothetical protein